MFVYVFQSFSFSRALLSLSIRVYIVFFLFWSSTNVVIILLFYVLLNYALRRDVLRSLSLSQIFRSISVCYSLAFLITGRFSLALSSIHFTSYLGYVLVKEGGLHTQSICFLTYLAIVFAYTRCCVSAKLIHICLLFFNLLQQHHTTRDLLFCVFCLYYIFVCNCIISLSFQLYLYVFRYNHSIVWINNEFNSTSAHILPTTALQLLL